MPVPVSSFGTPGNVLGGASGVSVPVGKALAGILDLASSGNASIEARLCCESLAGAAAPTAGTVFTAYRVYGDATPITLSAAASAGASSLSVSSGAGLRPGAKVALAQATPTHPAEIVTVGAGYTIGSTTVPLAAGTTYAYGTGDVVYLLVQSTGQTITPMPATGIAANTPYSADLSVGCGLYAVAASNPDAAQPVTATITADLLPKSFA